MKRVFLMLVAVATMPISALSADETAGRYQLKEAEGGVVRLDTATGDMTFCKIINDALECSGIGQNSGFSSDIARLTARIEKLEKAAGQMQSPEPKLPSDEDIERSLSIMEKFMRRFMGMVEELDKKNNEEDTLPQKT
jgi:hypothetical protein